MFRLRFTHLGARAPGFSFPEVVVVLTIVMAMAGVGAPMAGHAVDEARARHAAGFVAGELRAARQQALYRSRTAGLVFDEVGGRWTFRACTDGNGDGLRRADIRTAVDPCGAPQDVHDLFPGVEVVVSPVIPGPEGDPATADAVRFGASDIASFSPEGSCTAGTVFLRGARGSQFAIRVGNITGRIRVLQYNAHLRQWGTV